MNRTLTRRIAYIEQFDLFVGIDLGKELSVAILIDRRNKRYGRFQFGHTRAEYEKLVKWLAQERAGIKQPRVLVGMEPTNDYWQWLATHFETVGITYRLVNSFTVKKTREGSQLDYAKDDPRDGTTIAYLLCQGQFTETQLQSEMYAQMRQYEQAHWQLRQAMRRQKTILRQQVERLFPELRQIFADFTGKTITALLQNHAAPHRIAELSWDVFLQAVRKDFTGQQLVVSKLRQVYDLAPQSIGIQPGAALEVLIRQASTLLTWQQQQLDDLEARLIASLHTLPLAPYLLSIGMGALSSALIAAELGDLRHFHNAKQLVKLAGIQPTPDQSGKYKRQKTPMSRKGRVRLRTYLFWATMRLIRWDSAFQAHQHLLTTREHNPLKKLEAVGALMNKLLHLLWSLCRQHTTYSPERFAPA